MTRNRLRVGGKRTVAMLAAAGLLAFPVTALADNPTLSIEAEQGGFFGFLHSSKHSCELNRTVKLFKVGGQSNKLIGTDEAQPNGPDSQWNVNTDKSGKFFAKVGAKGNCKAVVSKTVHSEG